MILILEILFFSVASEYCHQNCYECIEYSDNENDMKCISCKDNNTFLIYNTTNCEYKEKYKNYYLNKSDSNLYPCSLFENTNCYGCDPYLNSSGICLSCIQGYKYNEDNNTCEPCYSNEYPIIKGNNETCFVTNEKDKNRILFINWFNDDGKYLAYPSYNVDNSGYLLTELTCDIPFSAESNNIKANKRRKLYFYNEEGRGLFDDINDKYEMDITLHKEVVRAFSTSIAIKLNHSDKYKYYLNFENYDFNVELFDLKGKETNFEAFSDIFQNIQSQNNVVKSTNSISSIQLYELLQENQYLFAQYASVVFQGNYKKSIIYLIFTLKLLYDDEKINIFSINVISSGFVLDVKENSKFSFVQNNKDLLFSYKNSLDNYLWLYNVNKDIRNRTDITFENGFHKMLFIKDNIDLICYYSNFNKTMIKIINYEDNGVINYIQNLTLTSEKNIEMFFNLDIIMFSENKSVLVVRDINGKNIEIFVINFFDDYKKI